MDETVKVRTVLKLPVRYAGELVNRIFMLTPFGFTALHGVPPPVQEAAGTMTTGVCAVVLTVCDPLHPLPNVVPEQV